MDRGATWLVIGRVVKPATTTGPGASSNLPEVTRVSRDGMAFAVGGGRVVRLLPDAGTNRKDKAAIVANLPSTAPLFKDFLPAVGSPVQQVVNRQSAAVSLATGYTPQEDDLLLFTVRMSEMPADKIRGYAEDAATNYRERALAQIRARGGKATKGNLFVEAQLVPGDTPSAVTFLVDGGVMAIMNHSPYATTFDTRQWSNGEHLVEVKALGENGVILSRKKGLVVIDNSQAAP